MEDPSTSEPAVIGFGVFEVDLRTGELRKQGRRIGLQEQPFRVLAALLERPGEVVTRDELRTRLWTSDVTVDFDHNLNKAINKLRAALGDLTGSPRYIETLPRRGYRFLAQTETRLLRSGAPPPPQRSEPGTAPPTVPPAFTTAETSSNGSDDDKGSSVIGPATADLANTRWQATRLTWLVAGVGMAALVLAGVLLYTRERPSTPSRSTAAAPTGKVTLAVLPFRNLSEVSDDDYFSDGLTEEMITQLGQVGPGRLGVIATTSVQRYKGSNKPLPEIARELGVTFLLEGTVRRTADRVRITCRLIQAGDQTQTWSETFDRALSDIFDIQSDVAREIARSLAVEFLPGDAPRRRAPTENMDAHEAYLRGRFLYSTRTRQGLLSSLDWFQKAIAADTNYAMGYVGLADSYNLLAEYGNVSPKEALAKSRAAAVRALELDESLAEAHANLGWTHSMSRELVEADRRLARAISLNPGYMSAHQWRAGVLRALGRGAEADEEIRLAQELDPVSPIIQSVAGWHHYLARRPAEAIAQCLRVIASNPEFPRVYSYLGWAYLQTGEHAKAVEALRKAVDLFGGSAAARQAELAHGLAVAGQASEARAILDRLAKRPSDDYVEADLIARVYAALGEPDRAFAWLNRALDEQAVKLLLIGSDPAFDPIRSDPRFAAFMARAGLPPVR